MNRNQLLPFKVIEALILGSPQTVECAYHRLDRADKFPDRLVKPFRIKYAQLKKAHLNITKYFQRVFFARRVIKQ